MTDFIVNYTPHAIMLLRPDGSQRMLFESRGLARVEELVAPAPEIQWDPFGDYGMHDQIDVVCKSFGAVSGLPEPKPSVLYIVSQLVFDAARDRCDLLVPHDIVRDKKDGHILGCRGFACSPSRTAARTAAAAAAAQ